MYGQIIRPDPDPTTLTAAAVALATDTLRREMAAAVRILEETINGQRAVVETRLAGMDEAIKLTRDTADKLPTRMDEKVRQLELLHDERFKTVESLFDGVALQFKERDTRSERESRDNKVAVDAAFAAQKEAASEQNKSNTLAIDKSEKATAETLNKQADLFSSTTDALDGKHNDLKERVTRLESFGIGTNQARAQQQTSNTSLVGILGLVIGALIGVAGIVIGLVR